MSARNAKEIASIKTANLKSETLRILGELRKAIRPEQKRNLLKNVRRMELDAPISAVPSERSQAERLTSELARSVMPLLINADASIEPVRSAMRLRKFRRSRTSTDRIQRLESEFESVAETVDFAVSTFLSLPGALRRRDETWKSNDFVQRVNQAFNIKNHAALRLD